MKPTNRFFLSLKYCLYKLVDCSRTVSVPLAPISFFCNSLLISFLATQLSSDNFHFLSNKSRISKSFFVEKLWQSCSYNLLDMALGAAAIEKWSMKYRKMCEKWVDEEPFPPNKSARKYFGQFVPTMHEVRM